MFRKKSEDEDASSDNVGRGVVRGLDPVGRGVDLVGRGGRRRRKVGRIEREGSRRVRIVVRRRQSSSESDQCNANDAMMFVCDMISLQLISWCFSLTR